MNDTQKNELLHKLLSKLNDEIVKDPNNADYQHFIIIVQPHLTKVQMATATFCGICNHLETKGKLNYDKLDLLKDIFPKERNEKAYELIIQAELKLKGK